MYILVVEDDKKTAAFLRKGLQEEGHIVDVANDGETGLALALVNGYDLIILDIMLPEKNGMEVLRELRAQRISGTKPIAVTIYDKQFNSIKRSSYQTLEWQFCCAAKPRKIQLYDSSIIQRSGFRRWLS